MGASRRVDVAAIEKELRQLGKATPDEEGGAAGTARACALNLVIVSEGATGPNALADLIGEITAEHPCRVFDVRADPRSAPAALSAGVSAHCHRPAGSARQVCCEQVTLHAVGEAVDDLPGTIAPLLVPDLPVFVWWQGEPPFAERRFERLVRDADRLIVDSAQGGGSASFIAALAGWRLGSPRSAAPGDLNWRRLSAWRSLVAGLFDAPDDRAELARIRRVEIGWPTPGLGGVAARCFYLAGWLVSRLGWKLLESGARIEDNGFIMTASAGTHGVTVVLRGTRAGEGPCARSLSLQVGEEADGVAGRAWVARVEASAEASYATCRVTRPGRPGEVRHEDLGATGASRLVGRELETAASDRVFEEALVAAGGIARLWLDRKDGGRR